MRSAQHPTPAPEQEEHAHGITTFESRDLSLSALIKWAVFLFAFIGFCSAVTYGIYRFLVAQTPEPPGPVAGVSAQRPPEPRLQTEPRADMRRYRQDEERSLNSYGWVDRSAGVVHIPIQQAMNLLVQRGLPTPTGAAANPPNFPGHPPTSTEQPTPGEIGAPNQAATGTMPGPGGKAAPPSGAEPINGVPPPPLQQPTTPNAQPAPGQPSQPSR